MKNLLSFLMVYGCFLLSAQTDYPFPSLSPKGNLSQRVGNTLIKVEYERPSARGRKIFGELVPWGKVWRTGAGKCTKISFDQDVTVGGQSVPRGIYSLLTIPNPDSWMVILNADTSLYGAYDYEKEKDVARFFVRPYPSQRFYETLTIDLDIIPNDARMYISWADVQLSFEIETRADQKIEEYIEQELLTGKDKNPNNYTMAADYLYFQNRDLKKAIVLAQKAQEMNPMSTFAASLQIYLNEKLGYHEKAMEAILRCIEITKKQDYEQKYILRDIRQLEDRYKAIEAKIKK